MNRANPPVRPQTDSRQCQSSAMTNMQQQQQQQQLKQHPTICCCWCCCCCWSRSMSRSALFQCSSCVFTFCCCFFVVVALLPFLQHVKLQQEQQQQATGSNIEIRTSKMNALLSLSFSLAALRSHPLPELRSCVCSLSLSFLCSLNMFMRLGNMLPTAASMLRTAVGGVRATKEEVKQMK